ncbi:MAG TPA: radical SAM protein [Clostridia bacterium]|nr:radical SAM protein [Clostridia bacterium]
MIIDITQQTWSRIKNPYFSAYAWMYLEIYENFLQQVKETGMEIEDRSFVQKTKSKIQQLKKMGARGENDDKSIYWQRISPACKACRKGVGSATFFISLQCPRNCYYCFNPNQESYEYFLENERDCVKELEQIHAAGGELSHIALSGGEPLVHKNQVISFFQQSRRYFPDAHTRLYTNGDLVDRSILQKLQEAGLDEIRFSIRLEDSLDMRLETLKRINLAGEFIPSVMVEMPVLPGALEPMKTLLIKLDRIGISSINLLEFCFPFHNGQIFKEKGFQVKNPPYRVLYDYWYAGGLPIAQSELVCLDLLGFAIEQQLNMGVHYCSLENKHTGQIYHQNASGNPPNRAYLSPKDYFLKTAKVFGQDISYVQTVFHKIGYKDYYFNKDYNYLEFHVDKVAALRRPGMEVGISSSIMEEREDGQYVRELKVDLTYPEVFDIKKDV